MTLMKRPPVRPIRKKFVPRRRPYDIGQAYNALKPEDFKGDRAAFAWALAKARATDRGHEREYTVGMNPFEPFVRDCLDDMARENVRMWLEAYPGPR